MYECVCVCVCARVYMYMCECGNSAMLRQRKGQNNLRPTSDELCTRESLTHTHTHTYIHTVVAAVVSVPALLPTYRALLSFKVLRLPFACFLARGHTVVPRHLWMHSCQFKCSIWSSDKLTWHLPDEQAKHGPPSGPLCRSLARTLSHYRHVFVHELIVPLRGLPRPHMAPCSRAKCFIRASRTGRQGEDMCRSTQHTNHPLGPVACSVQPAVRN